MVWNALDTLLSIAGVLGAAFMALWMAQFALRYSGKVRVAAFAGAVLWLLISVHWLIQLVQTGL